MYTYLCVLYTCVVVYVCVYIMMFICMYIMYMSSNKHMYTCTHACYCLKIAIINNAFFYVQASYSSIAIIITATTMCVCVRVL